MRFSDFYTPGRQAVSFELFPPKTPEGMADLKRRLPRLVELAPDFITVTYGAMGSTRERTLEIASMLRNRYGIHVAHHLTCVGADAPELKQLLMEIDRHDIQNVVALRGDPPQGRDKFEAVDGGFRNAWQLVSLVRQAGDFGIAVAGYPEKHVEALDFESDLRYLKQKVDSGADLVITQLFYRNPSFFRFVARCREIGIQVPIAAGLLPILNREQIKRITGFCGCTIPDSLMGDLIRAGDDEEQVRNLGIRYTVEQAQELIERGVDGLHFYVLNRSFHIAEIMGRLRPCLKRHANASEAKG